MSLLDSSFWEVFVASLSPDIWKELWGPIGETLYMTAISSLIMLVFGIVIGILLDITNPNGLIPLKVSYTLSGWVINCLRSLPQMIMIILMIPVARLIFGKAYGTNACIIAIAASCIPMYARIVESSLLEIDKGKVEAAQAMGSRNLDIVFKVLLPETLPSLIRGFTVSVITVLSMTALAGMFGAGGIGDIAVRYGYQRFQHDRLFACVYILIVLVQLIQGIGNLVSKKILKTRNLV
ncbi:MAG: ABC transporter permease [Clostridiales bacterium]|nr:ABC transporter permease [Clostridiales bacterium]